MDLRHAINGFSFLAGSLGIQVVSPYLIDSETCPSVSGKFVRNTSEFILIAAGPRYLNDLHQFDPISMQWTDLSSAITGDQNIPRDRHGFTCLEGKLFAFGGQDSTGASTHEFMTSHFSYLKLSPALFSKYISKIHVQTFKY
jgi:hypothetical protein